MHALLLPGNFLSGENSTVATDYQLRSRIMIILFGVGRNHRDRKRCEGGLISNHIKLKFFGTLDGVTNLISLSQDARR